jgi:hypothetical protein
MNGLRVQIQEVRDGLETYGSKAMTPSDVAAVRLVRGMPLLLRWCCMKRLCSACLYTDGSRWMLYLLSKAVRVATVNITSCCPPSFCCEEGSLLIFGLVS